MLPSIAARFSRFRVYFVCIMVVTLLCQAQAARPLTRLQRQTITGELGSGLTGTGVSFNSLYGSQGYMDPYYQQNIINYPYDDPLSTYGYDRPNGYKPSYMTAPGRYDSWNNANYNNAPSWRGFGFGRGQRNPSAKSQYGVKY